MNKTIRESVQKKVDEFLSRINLAEQCSKESLSQLEQVFMSVEKKVMNEAQMASTFKEILDIDLEHDLKLLFKKIDFDKNGYITWNDLISYLLLEFQEIDRSVQSRTLKKPLPDPPRIVKSRHRKLIRRIAFYYEISPDRSSSFSRGRYLTISKEGTINYWSLGFKFERMSKNRNPFRKIAPTIVTDMMIMSDIQMICTSTTEFELLFYNSVAEKFDLQKVIYGFKSVVSRMSYYFSKNIKDDSRIILGDVQGNVLAMSFNPMNRGPFKHLPGQEVLRFSYENVMKGKLEGLTIKEFKNIHSDTVNQVAYYKSLGAFISCAECSKCSVFISKPSDEKIMSYKFRIPGGTFCFDFCEESQILVTGGKEKTIHVWCPTVPQKPTKTFTGHKTKICALVIGRKGSRAYSLSTDGILRVWNISTQTCIQMYTRLQSQLIMPVSILYNDVTHQLIIASSVIVAVNCEEVINKEMSDGFSHTKPVTCVLYNHLFEVVVSVGLDSCIVVWDPWIGNRFHVLTKTHTQSLFGKRREVEITAACFDYSEQLLITGARDGSLKIWNFMTDLCIRSLNLDEKCSITGIVWLENRILCAGWNKRITEIPEFESGNVKTWDIRHGDEILCVAGNSEVLVTGSVNGELLFWNVRMRRPYKSYLVHDPLTKLELAFPKEIPRSEVIAVRSLLFLEKRPVDPNVGNVVASLESGTIQVWSSHPAGGFVAAFSAIHRPADYVTCLATDPENFYLVTGHAVGYIKVWLLKNYASPSEKVSLPALRLKFPFTWKDKILGPAEMAAKRQPLMLLSSIQGHVKTVTSVQFIPGAEIIVSGSSDCTVRLWSLNGRYLNTFGTFRPWPNLVPNVAVSAYFENYRVPPDIQRTSSATTLKVLRGRDHRVFTTGETDDPDLGKVLTDSEKALLLTRQLPEPILGQNYKSTEPLKELKSIPLVKKHLAIIPIYAHLSIKHNVKITNASE